MAVKKEMIQNLKKTICKTERTVINLSQNTNTNTNTNTNKNGTVH